MTPTPVKTSSEQRILRWGSALSALVGTLGSLMAEAPPECRFSVWTDASAKKVPRHATEVYASSGIDVMPWFSDLAKLPELQKLTMFASWPENNEPAWALLPTFPALTELVVKNTSKNHPQLSGPIEKCENLTSLHVHFE